MSVALNYIILELTLPDAKLFLDVKGAQAP